MIRLWDAVKDVRDKNLTHRNGHNAADASQDVLLSWLLSEVMELIREPNNISELADINVMITQYAQKMGWSKEELEDYSIRKLSLRYGLPQESR